MTSLDLGGKNVEERLEALTKPWLSFVIEFPTYPKMLSHGREDSQRILFLCPRSESNPTELNLALFGSQIVMHRLPLGEVTGAATDVRFIFVYASETPDNLNQILAGYQTMINAPVLVAQKSNVVRTAQYVTEFLSRAMTPNSGLGQTWPDAVLTPSGAAGLDPGRSAMAEDNALWRDSLPEIMLVDDEDNRVRAATELQDYRAEYACRYVLAHFQENINRDKMAEMVNLSPGYFSNLFRAEVGMSFSDYLIQVRIENAKSLLRRFDLSVEAISKQCGFNSLAHFSRTFKDRCGVSPLKYRKNPKV